MSFNVFQCTLLPFGVDRSSPIVKCLIVSLSLHSMCSMLNRFPIIQHTASLATHCPSNFPTDYHRLLIWGKLWFVPRRIIAYPFSFFFLPSSSINYDYVYLFIITYPMNGKPKFFLPFFSLHLSFQLNQKKNNKTETQNNRQ